MVELLGYESREELLTVNVKDLYLKAEDREGHLAVLLEQGFAREHPVPMLKKDGTVISTLITSMARKDSSGRLIGVQGTVKDVTELEKAEKALRESEERFRTIFQSINDAIFIHDIATGQVLDINPTMCAMYGYTRKRPSN